MFSNQGEEPNDTIEVKIKTEISDSEAKAFPVKWMISLTFKPFFTIETEYLMDVRKEVDEEVDADVMVKKARYPVLAEFSFLVSTLTKAMGGVPLVVDPGELLKMANKS